MAEISNTLIANAVKRLQQFLKDTKDFKDGFSINSKELYIPCDQLIQRLDKLNIRRQNIDISYPDFNRDELLDCALFVQNYNKRTTGFLVAIPDQNHAIRLAEKILMSLLLAKIINNMGKTDKDITISDFDKIIEYLHLDSFANFANEHFLNEKWNFYLNYRNEEAYTEYLDSSNPIGFNFSGEKVTESNEDTKRRWVRARNQQVEMLFGIIISFALLTFMVSTFYKASPACKDVKYQPESEKKSLNAFLCE